MEIGVQEPLVEGVINLLRKCWPLLFRAPALELWFEVEICPTDLVLVKGILEVQRLSLPFPSTLEVRDHSLCEQSCLSSPRNLKKTKWVEPLTFSFQNWKSIVLAKCQWVLWVGTIRQFRCPFFQPLCCRCKPPAKAFLCNHIVENEGSHSKVVDCTLKFLLDARIHVGVELDYGFRLCLPYLEGTANRCLGFPILTRMGEREGLHYCTWSDELNNIQKTFSNRSSILKSNKIEVTYLSPCASKCCCGSSSPVLLHCWSTRIWRSRLKQWAARLCKLCIVNPDVMVLSACNSLNTIFANQKY